MRYHRIAAVCVLTLAVCGCNSQDPDPEFDTISIEGTLKIDGKPFGPARIALTPDSRNAMGAEGAVDKNGKFTLKTRGSVGGIPEGEYRVTVDEDTMSGKGVPNLEEKIIKIKKPDRGGVLKLVIQLKSKKKTSGPGNPSGGGKKGPGGI